MPRPEKKITGTFCTFTGVLVGTVGALGSILARSAGALVNVYLAKTA